MISRITDTVWYVGANDYELDLFEGQYRVPHGMAYNSYVIQGEKTAVMDSIDIKKTDEWLGNLREVLKGKAPDYLIVQHMEPDHSASIDAFLSEYGDATIVGNKKTFSMMEQFFPERSFKNRLIVSDGDTLDLGERRLKFHFAPMVHWPEVMMTYDDRDGILFSADAFGKFGTLDVEDDWVTESRRYYIGIVGKYGMQVLNALKKVSVENIRTICPLHGPTISENIEKCVDLYKTWAAYQPEQSGVCIAYTSVYGNTKKAVELLAGKLAALGVETEVYDLARDDFSVALESAFKFDRLVLATTTYNSEIFPFMKQFIDHLCERNFSNRAVGFIENGSWAPAAMRIMKDGLSQCRNLTLAQNNVTIMSALDNSGIENVGRLAEEMAGISCEDEGTDGKASGAGKKYICKICGYVYEGEELPPDYMCPLCKQGADAFELAQEDDGQVSGEAEASGVSRKYVCQICGYVYEGEELPPDYKCPLCNQGPEAFKPEE